MSKLFATALLTCAFVLTGCSTVNPYTRQSQTAKATNGALIGAAAGAALGLITGDSAASRRDRAAIGAAAGAAIGGGIGYYMDKQEAQLRRQLESTGVSVTRQGNRIILNMPGNITFATDSASVSARAHRILGSVSQVLNEYDQTNILVDGHTDNTGAARYNMLLSKRRAQSVADVLVNDGVRYARIRVNGFGENRPIATNATAAGRAANRRVELTLVPVRGS
ncbi:MAG TPA: OmpA family protein [Oleiagrimonas sp.]|nr:OmpA family protein [Oleiagrimonas sp.]